MFYSTGLLLRFGNVDNVFSLVTGLKYRWFRVMPEYDGYYDNGNIEWQYFAGGLNVPLNIRFNVHFFFFVVHNMLYLLSLY